MHVAVDQPWRHRRPAGIDDAGTVHIEIGRAADAGDAAVGDEDRVGIENRRREIAAQNEADVADHEPAGAGVSGGGSGVGHGAGPPRLARSQS